MARELTERERAVLLAMIDRAEDLDPDATPIDAQVRASWRAQAAGTRAGRPCDCGTCPSIELEDGLGRTPPDGPRRVLSAWMPGAMLLLFVDDDRLSYLELAPVDDDFFTDFPPVDAIDFAG